MILQDTASAANQAGYVTYWNNAPAETAWVGFGTPGSPHFSVVNARNGGDLQLLPGPGGGVTVRGNIRLGPSGQFQAASGVENLRLLRGEVDGNGAVLMGNGFSVHRLGEGVYTLTFNPAFSGTPTVIPYVVQASSNPRKITLSTVTPSEARIVTEFIDNFLNTDSDWSFCAIGPR